MVRRSILTILFTVIFSIVSFIGFNSYAQETVVASGAKVTDPTNTGAASSSISIEVPPGKRDTGKRGHIPIFLT